MIFIGWVLYIYRCIMDEQTVTVSSTETYPFIINNQTVNETFIPPEFRLLSGSDHATRPGC